MSCDRALKVEPGDRAWRILNVPSADHFRQAPAHIWLMADAEDPFGSGSGDSPQEFVDIDSWSECLFDPDFNLVAADLFGDDLCGLFSSNQRAMENQFGRLLSYDEKLRQFREFVPTDCCQCAAEIRSRRVGVDGFSMAS